MDYLGYSSCEILVRLLEDPNSNLRFLNIGENSTGNNGVALIANVLLGRNKQMLKLCYSDQK